VKRQLSRARLAFAGLTGLAGALIWHVSHSAGEEYSPSLTDSHFWLHLLIEGALALYLAAITYVVLKLVERINRQ
jgi:hypothetical protein